MYKQRAFHHSPGFRILPCLPQIHCLVFTQGPTCETERETQAPPWVLQVTARWQMPGWERLSKQQCSLHSCFCPGIVYLLAEWVQCSLRRARIVWVSNIFKHTIVVGLGHCPVHSECQASDCLQLNHVPCTSTLWAVNGTAMGQTDCEQSSVTKGTCSKGFRWAQKGWRRLRHGTILIQELLK